MAKISYMTTETISKSLVTEVCHRFLIEMSDKFGDGGLSEALQIGDHDLGEGYATFREAAEHFANLLEERS